MKNFTQGIEQRTCGRDTNGNNWLDAGGGNDVLFGRKKREAANDSLFTQRKAA